jgi:FkbM family methyltransferase
MQPATTASPRPFSLFRAFGKFAYFLARGHKPARACWLARHDAPRAVGSQRVEIPALVAAYRADPSWADLQFNHGRVESKTLGIAFHGDSPASRGYAIWLALARRGWAFSMTPAGGLIARHGELSLALGTDEETEMIREIHLDSCYDLHLPGRTHVIDIGGNVGMSALWFAQLPEVEQVTAFEPFAPTAAAFKANLGLNPQFASRVTLVAKALGEADTTLRIDYVPELRGSMSVVGLGAWRGETRPTTQSLDIDVVRAAPVLGPLIEAARRVDAQLLIKIDCEGSEYAILRDLDAAGLIPAFSAFIIEWHGQGPGELVATLQRHHFAVKITPFSEDRQTLGLIHAVRLSG